jgi:hypothetical protein
MIRVVKRRVYVIQIIEYIFVLQILIETYERRFTKSLGSL